MTAPIAGVDAVLARIAQIQAGFVSAGLSPKPVSTATSPATASFASALAGAQSSTALTPGSQILGSQMAGSQTAGSQLLGMPATGSVTSDQIVDSAKKYLGVPYVFGGTTSAGIDCSGLVQRAYGDLGISMPRIASDQAAVGTAVPSLAQAQPGDVLAFGQPAYHVAIYLGNNMMIAAPEPGENVKIQSVYQTPTTIRRVVDTDGQSPSSSSALPPGLSSVTGVSQYGAIFAQNEARYQLPTGLLAAVAQTESGGNPSAVSPAGAQGLMQLMPGTASGLGVNPWDPSQAVQAAGQLLAGYLHKFGSVPLALAAYNAGPGAVEQYGGVPPYTETQNYVNKITALLARAAA